MEGSHCLFPLSRPLLSVFMASLRVGTLNINGVESEKGSFGGTAGTKTLMCVCSSTVDNETEWGTSWSGQVFKVMVLTSVQV